jgi:tRNA G18 (ribose-2'-O)-methylase SpoU
VARIVIDSLEDARLAPFRDIRNRDPGDDGSRFIAEGRLVVERLLASDVVCDCILAQPDVHPDLIQQAERHVPEIDILLLERTLIRELVGYDFHRGVMAQGRRPQFRRFDGLKSNGVQPTMIVVCGVDNPENIGGLMRTAAAFGVSRVAITSDSACPFSRRALRVSMAAAFRLEWFELRDPAVEIGELSGRLGYRTVATALGAGAQPIADLVIDNRPLALVVGSEGLGLSESICSACTDRAIIPMRLGIDSLNVNVATAIFLHELLSN